MTAFINSTYHKFQEFVTQKETNQFSLKTFADTAVKVHGELKSRLYQYLSPKNVEFCSKLLHAIPMALVLNTLTAPQLVVVSAIGAACLWSCKKEFLPKDSKINLLHSMAIAFFANIVSCTTELSLGILFRLPINAALMAGSLFLSDKLEGQDDKVKPETKNPEPIELPDLSELKKDIQNAVIDQLAS